MMVDSYIPGEEDTEPEKDPESRADAIIRGSLLFVNLFREANQILNPENPDDPISKPGISDDGELPSEPLHGSPDP